MCPGQLGIGIAFQIIHGDDIAIDHSSNSVELLGSGRLDHGHADNQQKTKQFFHDEILRKNSAPYYPHSLTLGKVFP